MFHGSIVALVTPFSNGTPDEKSLARLVSFHLDNGTHAIVPVGTTGESPTVSRAEHKRIIELVVTETAGQIPVIAGAGSYNTADAIVHARDAAEAGADAVLHVTGYYNRPNQEGIYQHFKTLSETTDLPIVVYNVPSRTIVDIQPHTMARIAALKHVVGVKDATGDVSRPVKEALLISKEFCFISGEDPTAVGYNAQGGNGAISVTANVAPALCSTLQNACAEGDYKTALNIQRRLMPLHEALFSEPSPAGVKYACSLLQLCKPECRLPMVELRDETKQNIQQVMQELGLIQPTVA